MPRRLPLSRRLAVKRGRLGVQSCGRARALAKQIAEIDLRWRITEVRSLSQPLLRIRKLAAAPQDASEALHGLPVAAVGCLTEPRLRAPVIMGLFPRHGHPVLRD